MTAPRRVSVQDLSPRDCVSCPRVEEFEDGLLLCVEAEDGRHRVMGRQKWSPWYDDLGGHEQLDSARALAESVLAWQDIEDGERVWLATLTFRDVEHGRGSYETEAMYREGQQVQRFNASAGLDVRQSGKAPGIQHGRNMVERFVTGGDAVLSSWLITEERGHLGYRLHYHGVLVAESHVGVRHIRPWWRGSKRPHVVLADSHAYVVAYILKYCFKDLYSGKAEGWLTAGRRQGQSTYMPELYAIPELGISRGVHVSSWRDHDQGARFDIGKPPDVTRENGAVKRPERTDDQLTIAKRMLADGWKPGGTRRLLMEAWIDYKRELDLGSAAG